MLTRISFVFATAAAALLATAAQADIAAEFVSPSGHSEELGAGDSRLAQTFTSGVDASLTSIGLGLRPGLSDILVELRGVTDSLPNDTVLASGTLTPDEQLLSGLSLLDLAGANVSVAAGQSYAILLTQSSAGGDPTSNAAWRGATGNAYSGGDALESIDGGTSWFPLVSALDFNFQVNTAAGDGGNTSNEIVGTPEPASLTLLALGAAGLLSRRRPRA